MLSAQQICQLDQADVLLRRHRRKDHPAERLDAMRACVAALWFGLNATCRVDGLHPAHGAAAETPNRSAAPRRDMPSDTAATNRVRRSMDSVLPMQAGLLTSL